MIDAEFFPNPVKDQLHIKLDSDAAQLSLTIVNALGEKVIVVTTAGKGSSHIDCSSFPAGIYFLRISGEQSSLPYVSKFMKN